MPGLGAALGLAFRKGGAWSPFSLPGVQWLFSLLAPSTVVDRENGYNAELKQSNCLTLLPADYITLTDLTATTTNVFSVMCWVRLEDDVTLGDTNYLFADPSSEVYNRLSLKGYGAYCQLGGAASYNFSVDWGGNVWRLFTLTKNVGTVSLYQDAGSPQTSTTMGTDPTDLNFRLGRSAFGIDGGLVDFRVFDRVLTQEEITAAYAGVSPDDPLYRLPMAEGSGGYVYDSVSGKKFEITSTDIPAVRAGRFNYSHLNMLNGFSKVLSFDGTTSYADTGVVLDFGSNDYSGSMKFRISGNYTDIQHLLDGRASNDNGFRVAYLGFSSTPACTVWVSHNSDDLKMTGIPLNDGEWHTLRWNKTNTTLSATLDAYTNSMTVSGDISASSAYIGRERLGAIQYVTGNIQYVNVDGYFSYLSTNAHGTTLPDSTGTNDATLVNTEFLYVPALESPFDLVAPKDRSSFVLLGDSLTSQNGEQWETLGSQTTRGYFGWARAYLTDRVQLLSNEGSSGDTSSMILARVADVIAHNPDYCIVLAGINDIFQDVAIETITNNLNLINSTLVSAGVVPIWLYTPPGTETFYGGETRKDLQSAVNAHIATLPNSVDTWTPLANTDESRTVLAGATVDEIHWGERGAELIGRTVATAIDSIPVSAPQYFFSETDVPNFMTNPDFDDDASDWAASSCTKEVVVEEGKNKLVLTSTVDGLPQVTHISNISNGKFAAGDKLQLVVDLEWDISQRTAEIDYCHPYILYWFRNIDGSWDSSTKLYTLPSAERVAGMDIAATGRGTFTSPVVEVGSNVDRIYIYIGWEICSIGDTLKIHNITGYNAETAHYTDVLGLGLTNPACTSDDAIHNNAETLIEQNDFELVSCITVSRTGTSADGRIQYAGVQSTKPYFIDGGIYLSWVAGTYWSLEDGSIPETWTNSATGTFPPKTGWSTGSDGSPAPTLSYSTPWVASEEFTQVSYSNLLAHLNLEDNVVIQRNTVDGACRIYSSITWAQDKAWTLAEYEKIIDWLATDCGAGSLVVAYDVNGEAIFDSNGALVLAQP